MAGLVLWGVLREGPFHGWGYALLAAGLGVWVAAVRGYRMPRCDGVEATRRIRARHPATHVVVLTTYADDDSLFPALRAGARGYLTKDAGGEEIVRAVRHARRRCRRWSPTVCPTPRSPAGCM